MIRLALIFPKDYGETPMEVAPPFNLGYLASYSLLYAKNNDIPLEVKIIDEVAGQDVEGSLNEFKPNIIGITATTPLIKRAYDIAAYCKSNIDAVIVMGGPHVTAMPEEGLENAHVVVKGEGELALAELIHKYNQGTLGKEGFILEKPYIDEIDEVPIPAFHLMDMSCYTNSKKNVLHTFKFASPKSVGAALLTTRGCPFKCIFCHNSKRTKPVRYHSPQRVISEIKYLMTNYGVNAVFFFDDEFLTNRKRIRDICSLIRENNLNFQWACQARADIINEEVLLLIKEHGCTLIGFGFESGCQRILNILKKSTVTVEENARAVELCKKVGLKIYGNFMLGTPSETKEEMMETMRFIEKYSIDNVSIAKTTPLPGTTLWDECIEKGIIPFDLDYSRLNLGRNAISVCDTMTKEEFDKFFEETVLKTVVTMRGNSIKDLLLIAVKRPSEVIKLVGNPQKVLILLKFIIGKFSTLIRGSDS